MPKRDTRHHLLYKAISSRKIMIFTSECKVSYIKVDKHAPPKGNKFDLQISQKRQYDVVRILNITRYTFHISMHTARRLRLLCVADCTLARVSRIRSYLPFLSTFTRCNASSLMKRIYMCRLIFHHSQLITNDDQPRKVETVFRCNSGRAFFLRSRYHRAL